MIYDKFIRLLGDKIPFRFRQKLHKVQIMIVYLRQSSHIDYVMYFDSTTAALVDPYYNKILFAVNYYDIRGAPKVLMSKLDDLLWFWNYEKDSNKNRADNIRYQQLKKYYKYE